MNYLDASVVVALLTPEVGSDRAEAWLQATEDKPCISPWVNSEVSSALSIKVRTGALSLETRAIALADWHRLRDASLAIEPIIADNFNLAATYCDHADLKLRAGDALHLAICFTAGHRLVTLDPAMADAALALGIPAVVP